MRSKFSMIVELAVRGLTYRMRELEVDQPPWTLQNSYLWNWKKPENYHFSLIILLEDDETLEKEQEILHSHDKEITVLTIRIKQLTKARDSVHDSSHCKTASRKLVHIEKTFSSMKGDYSLSILHQYEEQIHDHKIKFADISKNLMPFDLRRNR